MSPKKIKLSYQNLDLIKKSQTVEIGECPNDLPIKVIQFGEGNFLRGFVDVFIDQLNEKKLFNGKIAILKPTASRDLPESYKAQDYLYTVITRGMDGGKPLTNKRLIQSIKTGLNPHSQWSETVALFKQDSIEIVVSNTTEAGIVYTPCEFFPNQCPDSFPAKLTLLLYERFLHFEGDKSKGLLILPCELIEKNGEVLRECIIKHIDHFQLPSAFKDWIIESNTFCNCLVDRIVPGFPKEEADSICDSLGYEDKLLCTTEIFHMWVIEGAKEKRNLLPFDKIGLNIIYTDDLEPYRVRKVRCLNGAHTTSALAAYLCNFNFVKEMFQDKLMNDFLATALFDEILPGLAEKENDKKEYAKKVLERFQNPYLNHELLSISLNSVSKWKVRILPSILDFIPSRQRVPERLTFSLAALFFFYKGKFIEGEYKGKRGAVDYVIKDSKLTLEWFAEKWKEHDEGKISTEMFVRVTLSKIDFWDIDLTTLPKFSEKVFYHLENMILFGMRTAIEKIGK